jgi:hypothetical protein
MWAGNFFLAFFYKQMQRFVAWLAIAELLV